MSSPVEKEHTLVDCSVLEAAKENIQPLAKGRRVTALSAIFSTSHQQRDSQLAVKRAQFRAEVETALSTENGDALDAYSRFVDWTIEHYPQGHSAESGIVELLEEATRSLKDNDSYRNDERYLNLWILYATYVDRPFDIYAFLVANDIGTGHARLYEEYALAHERIGRWVFMARRYFPDLQCPTQDINKPMLCYRWALPVELSPLYIFKTDIEISRSG